MNEIEIMSTRW